MEGKKLVYGKEKGKRAGKKLWMICSLYGIFSNLLVALCRVSLSHQALQGFSSADGR